MSGGNSLFGRKAGPGLLDTAGLDMSRIFGTEPKTLEQTIAELLTLAAPPPLPPPSYNVLQALLPPFGIGSAYSAPRPVPAPAPVSRRVFFSFHYEVDILRSCIVRKSYLLRKGPKLPGATFYDSSLWEKSKREGAESLKRLIRAGMANSSVTCILAGTETWSRLWVRYEIAWSLARGNGLVVCYIHNVPDARHGLAKPGYNPLAFMGLQLRPDGRGNVCEFVDGGWFPFELHTRPVPWPAWMPKPGVGYLLPLADYASAYDYSLDDGYSNLPRWAHVAANAAKRR